MHFNGSHTTPTGDLNFEFCDIFQWFFDFSKTFFINFPSIKRKNAIVFQLKCGHLNVKSDNTE